MSMKFDIEKFDGKISFAIWRVQMLAVLTQNGLKKILSGKSAKPATTTEEQWEEMDEKALSTIQLCLSREVLREVINEKTAAGIWSKLESLYMTKSLANKLRLKERLFTLRMSEGFYFIPGALSVEEQCQWIRESLTSFPQPPNRTNHNAIYGPIHDLFVSAVEGKALVLEERDPGNVDSEASSTHTDVDTPKSKFVKELGESSGNEVCNSIKSSVLLRKLRWSTLGLQFDWSKRSYNVALPHKKIPDALCQLAKRFAAPAMPYGEEFQPEAAIVNYFGLGDMLGGHLDDMEKDWSKPIVSMSLGCKAIFLLGGKSREHSPVAMFLRSGDVVLMAGEARECFHGVPRIFTDTENAEIAHLELKFAEEDFSFLDYIRTSRININIRQVF